MADQISLATSPPLLLPARPKPCNLFLRRRRAADTPEELLCVSTGPTCRPS